MKNMNIVVNRDTRAFVTWLGGAAKIVTDYMANTFPNNPKKWLEVDMGHRYIRIIVKDTGTAAFAFIDRSNGDVLKPASWKAPAKHARGNIFDAANGLGSMGPYGPAYLK